MLVIWKLLWSCKAPLCSLAVIICFIPIKMQGIYFRGRNFREQKLLQNISKCVTYKIFINWSSVKNHAHEIKTFCQFSNFYLYGNILEKQMLQIVTSKFFILWISFLVSMNYSVFSILISSTLVIRKQLENISEFLLLLFNVGSYFAHRNIETLY